MARETELKLKLDKHQVPSLKRALARLGAKPAGPITLENIYYDTPELKLHAARIALRLRRSGENLLQTVKSAGHSKAGLSRRNEWETPWRGHFDFSAVEDAPTRALLETCAPALAPIFATDFKRSLWHYAAGDGEIEIALDDGAIKIGAYSEPLHELELELKRGPASALETLRDTLQKSVMLTPEDASKAERGYRLYHQLGVTSPSHASPILAAPESEHSMDLLLWRHAEAEDGTNDLARRLTRRGEKQAEQLARWLEKHQPKKLRVIVSPAVRCQQTASAFRAEFETSRKLAPGGSVPDLLAAAGWPDGGGATLIVGHQPALGQLAGLLLCGHDIDVSIKKGALWWFSSRSRDGERQTVLRAVIPPDLA